MGAFNKFLNLFGLGKEAPPPEVVKQPKATTALELAKLVPRKLEEIDAGAKVMETKYKKIREHNAWAKGNLNESIDNEQFFRPILSLENTISGLDTTFKELNKAADELTVANTPKAEEARLRVIAAKIHTIVDKLQPNLSVYSQTLGALEAWAHNNPEQPIHTRAFSQEMKEAAEIISNKLTELIELLDNLTVKIRTTLLALEQPAN